MIDKDRVEEIRVWNKSNKEHYVGPSGAGVDFILKYVNVAEQLLAAYDERGGQIATLQCNSEQHIAEIEILLDYKAKLKVDNAKLREALEGISKMPHSYSYVTKGIEPPCSECMAMKRRAAVAVKGDE